MVFTGKRTLNIIVFGILGYLQLVFDTDMRGFGRSGSFRNTHTHTEDISVANKKIILCIKVCPYYIVINGGMEPL